jgi:hypothetical protein
LSENYPIGHPDTILQSLRGAKWFHCLDFSNAYLALPLSEKSRHLTSFCTRKGQWEFKNLSAGLKVATSAYSRLVSATSGQMKDSEVYTFLDDWNLICQSFEHGLDFLQRVFERIRLFGMKLNPEKCELFQQRAKILGMIVTGTSIAEDPQRADKIMNWKFPRTTKEVRSLVGSVSWGRAFYPGLAEILKPFTDSLKKNKKIECTPETMRSFERPKAVMSNAPILALFDANAKSVVQTDCSGFAMGATLRNQYEDGSERLVFFASKCLNDAQTKYCATRRELLAVEWTLTIWYPYLAGRHFEIRVDNSALRFLLSTKDFSDQFSRYHEFFSQFKFDIVWTGGSDNNGFHSHIASNLQKNSASGGFTLEPSL